MGKIKLLVNLWLPVIIWAGFIFYLSSIPNLRTVESPFWDEVIRSFLHGVFYAILYLLIFRAVNHLKETKNRWLPGLLAIIYGFFDEIHQHFVPSRSFQIKDLGVDFAGVVVGFLLTLI